MRELERKAEANAMGGGPLVTLQSGNGRSGNHGTNSKTSRHHARYQIRPNSSMGRYATGGKGFSAKKK